MLLNNDDEGALRVAQQVGGAAGLDNSLVLSEIGVSALFAWVTMSTSLCGNYKSAQMAELFQLLCKSGGVTRASATSGRKTQGSGHSALTLAAALADSHPHTFEMLLECPLLTDDDWAVTSGTGKPGEPGYMPLHWLADSAGPTADRLGARLVARLGDAAINLCGPDTYSAAAYAVRFGCWCTLKALLARLPALKLHGNGMSLNQAATFPSSTPVVGAMVIQAFVQHLLQALHPSIRFPQDISNIITAYAPSLIVQL
jgi:hypothetical protein